MKLFMNIISLIALAIAVPGARGDALRNVQIGAEVPAFTVKTIAGAELSSADLKGKVVVLVYVAAEQRRSEKAADIASELRRELRNDDLVIVQMTADVTRTDFFRLQRDRLGIRDALGLDVGRHVYGALGLVVLPTTIVIDRDGRLARVISSFKSDHALVLRAYVERELGLIDDAALEKALTTRVFERGGADDRVARHRAAARLLRTSGLTKDAKVELEAALAIDPAHVDVRLDLASLAIAEGQFDEADTLIEAAMGTKPNHRRGTLMSGALALQRGEIDEAERILEKALLLNPDPVWTHYYLGLVREQRGDAEGASTHFKEAATRLLADRPI